MNNNTHFPIKKTKHDAASSTRPFRLLDRRTHTRRVHRRVLASRGLLGRLRTLGMCLKGHCLFLFVLIITIGRQTRQQTHATRWWGARRSWCKLWPGYRRCHSGGSRLGALALVGSFVAIFCAVYWCRGRPGGHGGGQSGQHIGRGVCSLHARGRQHLQTTAGATGSRGIPLCLWLGPVHTQRAAVDAQGVVQLRGGALGGFSVDVLDERAPCRAEQVKRGDLSIGVNHSTDVCLGHVGLNIAQPKRDDALVCGRVQSHVHALHLAQVALREVIVSTDSLAHRFVSVALLGLLDGNACLLVQLLHHDNWSIGLQRRHQLGTQFPVRPSNLREGKYATARAERTGFVGHAGARSGKPERTQFR
mmetsp:Transcript_19212/g.33218  ORF Transcript_19212/g.33218 Transcript_19212/m.33218 type:complete len:362 (+) Transcript_19212:43-1128(+)